MRRRSGCVAWCCGTTCKRCGPSSRGSTSTKQPRASLHRRRCVSRALPSRHAGSPRAGSRRSSSCANRSAMSPTPVACAGHEGRSKQALPTGSDQTLLLQSLLAARGVRTRLLRGRLGYTDATRLVGVAPQSAVDGDHWPLWVEAAASHRWLEADRDGEWVALDPSFSDAAVGAAIGVGGDVVESVPAELVARVRVDVVHGDAEVIGTERPSADLVSRRIVMWLEPLVTEEPLTPESSLEPSAGRERQPPPVTPVARVDAPTAVPVPGGGCAPRGSGASRGIALPPPLDAPAVDRRACSRCRAVRGDRSRRLDAAHHGEGATGAESAARVPWGGSPAGRIDVVVATGGVSDERLATVAAPCTRRWRDWVRSRCRHANRCDRRSPTPTPARRCATWSATRGGRSENRAPSALGWAALRGVERASAAGGQDRVIRPGYGSWRCAGDPQTGCGTGTSPSPSTTRSSSGSSAHGPTRPRRNAAYGVLQSAVLSQVLNRISVGPPLTAFDSTLRAVGTGTGLGWWTDFEQLPSSWPAAARAAASDGLTVGYAVVDRRQWRPMIR